MANAALLKRDEIKDAIEFVRSEKNLLNIGFFGAHDRRLKHESSTREVELDSADPNLRRKVIIQAPEFLGLPNTADLDKFLAFMKIVMEERARTGFIPEKIHLSAYRLLSELGLSDSGQNYEDVATWGNRMVATTIHSKSGLYYASVKDYVDDTAHVFRSFKRLKREKSKGKGRVNGKGADAENQRVETYEIALEDWVIDNLNEAYIVPEDFRAYRKLGRPISKAIFNLLHLWFFASGGNAVEKEYGSLCQRLNIRKYRFETKIRASIGNALDELVGIHYLKSWRIQRMLTRRDAFKIVMEPGDALLAVLTINRRRSLSNTDDASDEESSAYITSRLTKMGVSKTKLGQYLALPEDVRAGLVDKIEYIEHVLNLKKGTILNPAGFAIDFLDKDKPIPESFMTRRQKQKAQRDLKERLVKDAQNTAFYQAYEEWRQDRVEQFIDQTYTTEEFSQLLKEKLPQVYELHPNVRRMPESERMRQSKMFVKKEIADTMDLPGYEDWVESKNAAEIEQILQPALF